jgi:hypothetical protein
MSLIELCNNLNAHCENRDKQCWLEWHPTDFNENLELKRNGCYTFEYDNPDCSDCAEKRIFVSKVCDRCFEQYLGYRYAMREKEVNSKENELIELREKLLKMEMMLNHLMESR